MESANCGLLGQGRSEAGTKIQSMVEYLVSMNKALDLILTLPKRKFSNLGIASRLTSNHFVIKIVRWMINQV